MRLRKRSALVVSERDIVRVGRRFHTWQNATFHDREINEAYAVRSDLALTAYTLHPEEVDGLVAVHLEAGLRLFCGEADEIPALVARRGASSIDRVRLSLDDFVDVSDDYAIQTLTSIKAHAGGATHQPFLIRAG